MRFLSRLLGGDTSTDSTKREQAPAAAPEATPPRSPRANDERPWEFGALTTVPPSVVAAGSTSIVPDAAATAALRPRIVEALKTVFDPEIPVDIYELGLIYDISADVDRRVHVRMTLTSPACPSAQQLPAEVRYKVKAVEGVVDATVDVVWEPPWDKDRMSDVAKLHLGMF
jgi:FeS assembly SUF system protein